MKDMEIEKKFLVRDDSWVKEVKSSSHIVQGYLSLVPGKTVRVRIRDGKGFLTVKGPVNETGMTRFEWENEIPLEEATRMLDLAGDSGIIDKTRYLIPNTDGVHTWEVDVFDGQNRGLVMAEIELDSEDEPFDRPSWLGEEVSSDRRYFNSQLMQHPYSTWKTQS